MASNIVVTGLGVVSAIGGNVAENKNALLSGNSGIGVMQHLKSAHNLPVGEVKFSNSDLLDELQPNVPEAWSRTSLLALKAAREALDHSGLEIRNLKKTALISATTVGGMDRTEDFYPGFMEDPNYGHLREVIHHDCGASTELLSEEFGITDFVTTINTACSSSVNAMMLGARLIASGRVDRALVGGTDALSRFTLNGFNALMILSSDPCKPFDAERNGLNLGEGAGFLVIESEKSAKERGQQILARVSGFANTNDAFHQTASSPEGVGAQLAMRQSLQKAGLNPSDISAINAHGTATPNNDLAEGVAIDAVFGESVPPVSSTKAFTGHTLGAAGSIEAVYSILALQEQCVFPNLRLGTTMPEIGFDPERQLKRTALQHVMSNSFGFGGNCSSIILSAI